MTERTIGNPTFTAMVFGLAGGLVGAIIMGGIAYTIPEPNTGGDPFFVAAAKLIGFGTAAWVFGWLLHVIIGMGIGGVFGVAMSRVSSLRARRVGHGILLGVSAGILTWLVLFIPMMVLLMPKLVSLGSIGGGLLVNVTFGIVLGSVFAIGHVFFFIEPEITEYACEACSTRFPSQEELTTHRREKHLVEEQVFQV